jgi:hypothetical protein
LPLFLRPYTCNNFSSFRQLIKYQFLHRRLSLQSVKRVRYDSRQRVATTRLRVKGRFVRESESALSSTSTTASPDAGPMSPSSHPPRAAEQHFQMDFQSGCGPTYGNY